VEFLGHQITADLYGCNPETIANVEQVKAAMEKAAELAKCTLVNSVFHQFSPYGVSGAVIVQESDITCHTWPEHQYVAVDVFTCGDIDGSAAMEFLRETFGAQHLTVSETKRGLLPWHSNPA
jgi:S-adenosylmethionine decarboxylase